MNYIKIIVPIVAFTVFAAIFLVIFMPLFAKLLKNAEKREENLNEHAKANKYVAMDGRIIALFRAVCVLWIAIGIAVSIPQAFSFVFGDLSEPSSITMYIIINIVVWAFTIAMCVLTFLESKKVVYDKDGFTLINGIGRKRRYTIGDVVSISGERNKKIKLKNGSFTLFNAMLGLSEFIEYLNSDSDKNN